METIMDIFSESQRSAASHKSGAKKILQMLTTDLKKDYIRFILHGCIDKLLLVTKSSAYVERATEFTYKLIAGFEDDILQQTMAHITSRLTSQSKNVRQRACQIIDGTLAQMTERNVDLSLDVCADLSKHLLKRLNDKLPTIRQLAVRCLKSLQDPSDPNDACTEGIVNAMLSDSSHLVRVEAIISLVLFEGNVPQLCSRLRDARSEVRMATLDRLAEIDLRMIKNHAKPEVVKLCLTDRDEQVRLKGVKVVMKWLQKLCTPTPIHEAIPKLLGLVNPLYNEEVALLLGSNVVSELLGSDVQQVYSSAWKESVKDKTSVWNKGLDAVSVNDILWIYVRCSYARRSCPVLLASEICSALMPSADRVTELLSEARHLLDGDVNGKKIFVVKYLLRLTSLLGRSDAKLLNECESLLGDIRLHVDLVEPVLKALACLYTNSTRFTFSESVLMSINEMKEQAQAFAESDEELAIAYANRALQIAYLLVQREVGSGGKASEENDRGAEALTDPITQFQDLLPLVTSSLSKPVTNVRCLAVGCLGLLCLWSTSICDRYKRIIMQVVSGGFEQVIVRGQALKCVVDMACVHKELFREDAELSSVLLRAQDSEDAELVLIAAEGAAKLLFAGVVSEPGLFANLLKFFFLSNLLPSEEEDGEDQSEADPSSSNARLQQVLSLFFQAFVVSEGRCEDVAVGSISQLVADITSNIKFNGAKVTSLNMILKHLLSLCENAAAASAESQTVQPAMRDLVRERATGALCREVLKLGNTRLDKSIVKEYVKVLESTLAVQEWLTKDKAFTVAQVLQTLLDSVVLDKSSQQVLRNAAKSASKMASSKEHTSAGYQFMSSAPGLADLVALASKSDPFDQEDSDADEHEAEAEEEEDEVEKPRASRRTKASARKVAESEEDDENEASGDSDESGQSDNDEEDEDVENIKVNSRAAFSRSSKAAASRKIASQLVE